MKQMIEFIKNNDISVRTIEKALDLPNASISVNKELISKKHVEMIKGYLEKNYGYGEEAMEETRANNKPIKTFRWNDGRPYDFRDDLPRHKDEFGLWRVIEIEKLEASPVDGELKEDWQGKYLLLNNGIKAYLEMPMVVYEDIKKGKYKVGARPNFYYKKKDYTVRPLSTLEKNQKTKAL